MTDNSNNSDFVGWFRKTSPYIHAHRGRTFVIMFGGEAILDENFDHLIHDIASLSSLGIRMVLVHGARPQIEQRLRKLKVDNTYSHGLRVTDDTALEKLKDAVGSIRVEIEARLSMGLANTPMAGARIRVASGNFVTAKPLGVRDGIDYCHTGEVRRIDTKAIQNRLDQEDIVLLSPLGYSPTGEVFNLSAEEVATATAVALHADKLLLLTEGKGLLDSKRNLIRQLTPAQVEKLLQSRRKLSNDMKVHLENAMLASRSGVRRTHLLIRKLDGVLLQELFTRDGIGTMITAETYEEMRQANIDDVGGILELLKPLEQDGILVRRNRERLEMEIDHFTVIERDGMVIACAALYPFNRKAAGELACLAVHPDYQGGGRGDDLLTNIENQALQLNLHQIFVLTTHTAHWFRERGFTNMPLKNLPIQRKNLYNYQRNSKIFYKNL